SKKFRKLQVLKNVSVTFEQGQVISLIGPNGSGKTTLIKSILGMVKPDSGTIRVKDKLINGDPGYRSDIGYMPQIGRYPDNMKVGQLFTMMKSIRGASESDIDNDLFLKFDIKGIWDKPMRTLSGGTRQKVNAALAFLFNPSILILDEPTAGLDPLSSEILKEKIIVERKKNKLILITSHILSDLEELTTHIMYIQEGEMKFLKNLETLQEETGEIKLSKAIARIMKGQKPDSKWIDKMFIVKKNETID
ncbi:MAG: ABC transporter ATP-binding protein, partial [Chitinophagaceae bacterium]